MKILALGGPGAMGSVAVRLAAQMSGVDEIVIADRDRAAADRLCRQLADAPVAVIAGATHRHLGWRRGSRIVRRTIRRCRRDRPSVARCARIKWTVGVVAEHQSQSGCRRIHQAGPACAAG